MLGWTKKQKIKWLFQLLISTIFSPLNIKFPEKLPEISWWNVSREKSRTCVQQQLTQPHEDWCSSCWIPWNVFLQSYFGQLLHWPNQQHRFLIDRIVVICRIISWSSIWWFYFFLYYCIHNISWVGSFYQAGTTWSRMLLSHLLKAKLFLFFLNNFNNTVKVYVMLGDRESKNTRRRKTLAKNSNSQFTFVVLFMWTCNSFHGSSYRELQIFIRSE